MRKHPRHAVWQDVCVGWDLCPWLTPHSTPPFLILDGITLALIPQSLSVWVATEGCKQCISYLLSSWEASFIYMLMFTTATRLAGILWRVRMRQSLSHREQPAPPPGSHDFPFAHHLEMEGETRTGFPESLRGCSALLSWPLSTISSPWAQRGRRKRRRQVVANSSLKTAQRRRAFWMW